MSTQSGSRTLGAAATLESLKKEAKRWLKALRESDAAARQRLRRALPSARADVGLREVQHALALEHGLPSWAALKEALADRALAKRSAGERADDLLRHAVLGGFTELAQLLLDFGAQPERLDDVHAFQAACMSSDRETARRLLAAHPEYRRFPGPLYQAADSDRVDVAELLLELDVPPDVEHGGWTALHSAAHNNAVRVATLLIERGATIDIRDKKYHSTPLGHAVWAGNHDMVDLLSGVSRDVIALVRAGKLERLRRLLDEDPSLAQAMRDGRTALFFLSAPEERAVEIAELLLARAVDPNFQDADGLTAAAAAAKSGLEELADLLREAQSS